MSNGNLLDLPAALGHVILKFATAKYVEAAGDSAAMTDRAKTIKQLAIEVDGAAMGTISLSALSAATAADLTAKNLSVSSQILVDGLLSLVTSVLPVANTGLLSAAIAAEVNLFLQDVIAVAGTFGA